MISKEYKEQFNLMARCLLYQMTTVDYKWLLKEQKRKCKICEVKFGNDIKPSLDHDYKTLRLRGLLCQPCNIRVGRYEHNHLMSEVDSISIAKYLKEAEYSVPKEWKRKPRKEERTQNE